MLGRGGLAALAGPYLTEAYRIARENPAPWMGLRLDHVRLDDEGAHTLTRLIQTQGTKLVLTNTITPLSYGLFLPVVRGDFFDSVSVLDMSENPTFGREGMRLLRDGILGGKMPQLTCLYLHETGLDDACVAMLAECFVMLVRLYRLDIGYNYWTDEAIATFQREGRHLHRLRKLVLNPMLTTIRYQTLNALAWWITEQDTWENIEEVELFDPDDPQRPEDMPEPSSAHRRANEAVQAAVQLRAAKSKWAYAQPWRKAES